MSSSDILTGSSIEDSVFFSLNAEYIQGIYSEYLNDSEGVDKSWVDLFERLGEEDLAAALGLKDWDDAHFKSGNYVDYSFLNACSLGSSSIEQPFKRDKSSQNTATGNQLANDLLRLYRARGFLKSQLNPLINLKNNKLESFKAGLPKSDELLKDYSSYSDTISIENIPAKTISDLVAWLNSKYCTTLSYEVDYITDLEQKKWFFQNIESDDSYSIINEEKVLALNNVVKAEVFEEFLHKKFQGAKRFSLEGGTALIAGVEYFIKQSSKYDVESFDIAMAHRGRLSMLVNVLDKSYADLFKEFRGENLELDFESEVSFLGDVKYHLGCFAERKIEGKQIQLDLAYNPSHLEAANSIALGKTKAKQDLCNDKSKEKYMSILIHGDAAVIGQGVVAEALNMSSVQANDTGGVLHIVIDNQVGFTANPDESRSSLFASNVFKVLEIPILHVNGSDVTAVLKAFAIAADYRAVFKKDIAINLICYRKYGHNEGDEPNFTQPILYKQITQLPSLRQVYNKQLLQESVLDESYLGDYEKKFEQLLNDNLEMKKEYKYSEYHNTPYSISHNSLKFKADSHIKQIDTSISLELISFLSKKLYNVDQENYTINPKIIRLQEDKLKTVESGQNFNWSIGESLAFASLLAEGYDVRLSGQDSQRGTFAHRHSVMYDVNTEEKYMPLNLLSENQGTYNVSNSVLSEFAVLGFEHGYSLVHKKALVLWEAQFGDFANGAQVVFDQFICSSEEKWLLTSGVVMMLPHGFEGQGPEHSSARIERYLQSCANLNIRVAIPTNPANLFHLLRSQVMCDYTVPLVMITPKSLLRHKLAVSNVEDFTDGTSFKEVISQTELAVKKVMKVIFCTGKIYYDLESKRLELAKNDISLIRLEQIYPYPGEALKESLEGYDKEVNFIWCQEEPENMGCWSFIKDRINNSLSQIGFQNSLEYVGRKPSASPATGFAKVHLLEQEQIIKEALSDL